MDELDLLGRAVAQEQDRRMAESELLAASRSQLISAVQQADRARRRRAQQRARWGVGLSAAAALLIWGGLRLFDTLGPAAALHVGQAEESRVLEEGSAPLSFPDGSVLRVLGRTRMKLAVPRPNSGRVELVDGRVEVHVVHHPQTDWRFQAGPYQVKVTGTRFELGWTEESKRFLLRMQEGEVHVSGGQLNFERVLRGGEQLELQGTAAAGERALQGTARVQQGWEEQPREERASSGGPLPPAETEPRTGQSAAASHPAKSLEGRWIELAQAGEYPAAFLALTQGSLAHRLAVLPQRELDLACDVLRLSNHPAESRLCLDAMRRRFPGSTQAATAAFQLGRLGGREAVSWFETYLREQPSGPLAREASGRLLEAYASLGDRAAASRQARVYLSRYPNGPHAAYARTLLSD